MQVQGQNDPRRRNRQGSFCVLGCHYRVGLLPGGAFAKGSTPSRVTPRDVE